MPARKVDAVVLGAGNAGQAAAEELRAAGKSVVIVEGRDVGGTCPLRGCVPKKALVATAEALDVIARAARLGITVATPRLDWTKVAERKRRVIAGTSEAQEASLARQGIELVRGRGRFVGERTVAVGAATFEAEAIVVATGARPRPLDVEGADAVVTSDDLLDLEELPASLVFVGAGVVAFELTHVFARAGVKVTLLEVADRALGSQDPSCVARLVEATRALGVDVVVGAKVTRIERGAERVVHYEAEGTAHAVRAAMVANGAGRAPDYEGLDLAAAGVVVADGRPRLDAQLRSRDNRRVWFAGDARPGPQLSPVATYDGHLVARAILGGTDQPDYGSIPAVVFTIPPLASVGRTQARAADDGIDVDVIETDLRGWKGSLSYADDVGYAKVLVEKRTGRIAGAHLLRRRADEAIHVFAAAMKRGVTAAELKSEIFAFPTITAEMRHLVG